ncbi:hypothetical protein CEXT_428801 [Caerostris extrusa]|uniref:Uncharacterized protein n=1 Tax=Caerostris extrusa TaxID=172846 RepID=A0AAV4Q3D3_CAEEX|nr:hypothetical protein CEXT_428801 [Caerostris extrusa]
MISDASHLSTYGSQKIRARPYLVVLKCCSRSFCTFNHYLLSEIADYPSACFHVLCCFGKFFQPSHSPVTEGDSFVRQVQPHKIDDIKCVYKR